MKTFDLATLGVEELTSQEMSSNHGGGDSFTLLNIGAITIGNLVNVNGNSLFDGNYALFSGNGTDVSPSTGTSIGFSSSQS
ncbi:hypothetical protein [Spirosoma foliorum]|uniref:Bacteriocin n=1 Tax=Spirosoma foliorum TaxID=2710596 RepID=A0A7G5GWY4_9BACT|nr:hypothetical protein [Spirosoma foliorum]QMW03376.1 hypothetical protein H3H32_36940 [Spirosoma foliorum]QMW03409.1 hypothetical protein H3H32_00100 [Spirosoma foliorum]